MESEDQKPKIVQRAVTEEDLSMLTYYWDKAEDLDRFSEMDAIKKDLKRNYPIIWDAWKQYKKAKKVLTESLKFY